MTPPFVFSPIDARRIDVTIFGSGIAESPVVVLASFPEPRPTTNPYIVMLARELVDQPEVELRYFTWKNALLRRYDVFHAHWPEILVSGNPGIKLAGRRLLFCILLGRLWLSGVAVVRTQHNIRPHRRGRTIENFLLRKLENRTAWWITLNRTTHTLDSSRTTTILHGEYVDWFGKYLQPPAEPGQVLFAGLIRDYKNVPTLIKAFAEIDDPTYRLRIAGSPSSAELACSLESAANGDNRVTLTFEYISDEELADAVGRCEVMVLPYAEMHNSGAALMALSMRRPVLAPDNAATRSLADEVGPGWVYRFTGDLSAADIVTAITDRRGRSAGVVPDLTRRSWRDAGRRHLEVYRAAQQFRLRRLRRSGHQDPAPLTPQSPPRGGVREAALPPPETTHGDKIIAAFGCVRGRNSTSHDAVR